MQGRQKHMKKSDSKKLAEEKSIGISEGNIMI